jgi:hypothetical protein
VKSLYPFQAGAEATFAELYHGPWKASTALVLYLRPADGQSIGRVRAGAIVQAMVGETIVRNPIALIAQRDDQVVLRSSKQGAQVATMHKGDRFWVLDSGNEGGFAVWWHCTVVGWDSTSPGNDNPVLLTLGSNQERWVKVRENKTGLLGWFKFDDAASPQLVPANDTQKRTGE